ncbi:ATP-binding protein [Rhizobium sp. BK251]|uniref:sensor histidine kinase n=1 Tax=Rhizobium sp. BK251 TaxID=2512125 RepID=UPI001044382F|nr:ATP-binding protein [Rhizobium sp. BK251]TCL64657.1 signal transduction histidine kinase [Rhizobium sp. BK251]
MYPKENVTYVTGEGDAATETTRGWRFWHNLDLTTQFLVVAALIICGSMAVLGEWLSSQIAANQLRSRAESGALYMEGFLAGHLQEGADGPEVSAQRQKELDELLVGTDLARRIEGFRIWRRDGTVIYSTDKALMGKRLPSADIDRAFSGHVVAQLETGHDDETGTQLRDGRPLIEIYGPIYRSNIREVIAVGEIYEEAGEFIEQRDRVQRRTWWIVGATTVAIMGLLFLIVRRASNIIHRQSVTLQVQLASARALAEQNRQLRKAADRARMDASRSNENLLNRIGSDLHDGPVQLLSLLILRLGTRPVQPAAASPASAGPNVALDDITPSRLASRLLTELRELSNGLVLPEIEGLSLEAALRTAVERHEHTTGSVVKSRYSGLPARTAHPLKICLYRVVQEGLNNAFRHADGRDQRVIASADDKFITIMITDGGPGLVQTGPTGDRRRPLGLQGIRNRVEAFGGSVQIRQRGKSGMKLVARVPIESNNA